MAVLLTGGTGKTSARIAPLLQDAKIPFVLASRSGKSVASSETPAVKFEWNDDSTFSAPFQHEFPRGERVSAIFLVVPIQEDPVAPMKAFIDYAMKEQGVRRFVLLAGSNVEPGSPAHGKVWQYLVGIGVDYCILCPTWFMENFSEGWASALIKGEGKIYTACGDGKIPFISTADIAAVAFRALTDEKSHNTVHYILGPELLTHDQVAEKLSNSLGREIVHVKVTPEQRLQSLIDNGLPEFFAKYLTHIESLTAQGKEEKVEDTVERVTGRPARSFDEFAQLNKAVWQ